MPYFVFVEFTEPRLKRFLSALRDALQGEPSSKPIHITVRGPYVEPPVPEVLKSLSEKLRGRGVRLGGIGSFATPAGYVVFMRAESAVFRDIWWKPDFPEESHGMNPHVSLFETTDHAVAARVEAFLRGEQLRIHTFGVELSVYTSKQAELFGSPLASQSPRARLMHDHWMVRADILPRAKRLGASLRSTKEGTP